MTRGQIALKKALEATGSKKAFCKAMWLSFEELEDYLAGKKPVPASVASAAADIMKNGSNRRKQ